MQIRRVKMKVQLLRTLYVPAERDEAGNLLKGTGRSKVKMVGSFPFYASSITEIDGDLIAKLSDDEILELTDYLQEKEKQSDIFKVSRAGKAAIEALELMSNGFDPELVKDSEIDQIKEALSDLLKVRRAHKKRESA